jgi:hypothetical protein
MSFKEKTIKIDLELRHIHYSQNKKNNVKLILEKEQAIPLYDLSLKKNEIFPNFD